MGAKAAARDGNSADKRVEISDIEIGVKRDIQRDEDGDLEGTKGLDNKMLLQQQKNMMEAQDKQLGAIGETVDIIRFENQNFSKEVKLQNKMLDTVNDQIDDNMANMVKLDSRLKGLLAKGSICKLWIIIIVELILMVYLVINVLT